MCNRNATLTTSALYEWGCLEPRLYTLKLCCSLDFLAPNRYEIDLSNEILKFDFGQGAAKIPEVKVEVWKKNLPTRPAVRARVRTRPLGRYFFWPPTLTSDIFAAPWPKSMFSTSFERSTSYLFGAQSPRRLNEF